MIKKMKLIFVFLLITGFQNELSFAMTDYSLADHFPGRTLFKVNDYAGVLSPIVKSDLESQLKQFEKIKKIELIVTIIPDLGAMSLDEFMAKYSKKWFRVWPVENHRRIHVVICIKNAQIQIGVGYPLMRILHMQLVSNLIDQDFIPSLKEGDFDTALNKGISNIIEKF